MSNGDIADVIDLAAARAEVSRLTLLVAQLSAGELEDQVCAADDHAKLERLCAAAAKLCDAVEKRLHVGANAALRPLVKAVRAEMGKP